LGLTEVPVVILSGLTDLQRRQLMLADNRIALNAGWDLEMLNLELTDLSVLGADLEALGFTAEELAKALNPAGTTGLTGEDEVPELPEKAVTAVGDIWCAGPHRIACGDSTDPTSVAALLPTRPTGSTMIRLGVIVWASIIPREEAKSVTTTRQTGELPGACSLVILLTFGTERCTPRLSRQAL
jgi:hypothetical protein